MGGHIHCDNLDPLGHLVAVRVSHPGKFNAMSRSMWRDLKAVFDVLATQPGLRCVLVSGEGGHFCAGGDISEYPDFRFDSERLAHFHENEVWGGLDAMRRCPVPVVVAIEGNCMGAGLEMASCGDIRVAGVSARFGAPIARLGFPMAPREAQLVAQAVGWATAREMLLEAALLPADEMKARGFLNRVVDDAAVMSTAMGSAQRIVALAPLAARVNKHTLRAMAAAPADLAELIEGAYDYADQAEHREGIGAFLDKRQPVF